MTNVQKWFCGLDFYRACVFNRGTFLKYFKMFEQYLYDLEGKKSQKKVWKLTTTGTIVLHPWKPSRLYQITFHFHPHEDTSVQSLQINFEYWSILHLLTTAKNAYLISFKSTKTSFLTLKCNFFECSKAGTYCRWWWWWCGGRGVYRGFRSRGLTHPSYIIGYDILVTCKLVLVI